MSAPTTITLTPIFPVGPGVVLGLNGDTTYTPAIGGTGGWQIVDRPRLVAATQWYDRSPMELDIPSLADSDISFGISGLSIDPVCALLDSWQDKAPATQQPPVLAITGPVPVEALKRFWVVYSLQFDEASRDPVAGFRMWQKITLKLYEYVSPVTNVYGTTTPAQTAQYAANAANGTQGFSLYTVRFGDTMQSIAAWFLGAAADWSQIAALNNIRDPASIVVGQTLLIPAT